MAASLGAAKRKSRDSEQAGHAKHQPSELILFYLFFLDCSVLPLENFPRDGLRDGDRTIYHTSLDLKVKGRAVDNYASHKSGLTPADLDMRAP